ncbi:helix-turn-helix transcriptional regulator [Jeotgalibaca porci]|uniref:helix-turn-helix transcriptional regulator n=1 Tax=Jeotgalibaca porci TaxID=1868793 RepID=UPI003F92DD08
MDLGIHHSERTTNLNNLLRFIGRKITFFRRIRGVSQAEMADEVSIEKEEIDAIEKGKKDPSITKLYKISQFLRAKIEDFLPKKKCEQRLRSDLSAT